MRIGSSPAYAAVYRPLAPAGSPDRAVAPRSVTVAEDKRKDLQQETKKKEEEIKKLQQELQEAGDGNLFQQLGNWLFGSSGQSDSATADTAEAKFKRKP